MLLYNPRNRSKRDPPRHNIHIRKTHHFSIHKEWDKNYGSIVDAIADTEYDDPLTLKEAIILNPRGNASSIYRVFETELGEKVGIINGDFGLLEKSDLLSYGEIELPGENDEEDITVKYVLVYERNGAIQGFITGSDLF